MTLTLSTFGQVERNEASIFDAPAVRITAESATLINTERGRLTSTANGVATILINAVNSLIVNEDGASIRGFAASNGSTGTAIRGSAGRDIVDNSGSLVGLISLGDGNDVFAQRIGTFTAVDLGEGDDEMQVTGSIYEQSASVIGGAGNDRLVLDGTIGQAFGFSTRGFEQLDVGTAVINLNGFSGFDRITLREGASNNFLNSANPNVDLALTARSIITLTNSTTFNSVTGTDDVNSLWIRGFVNIARDIRLLGGDDSLAYEITSNGIPQIVGAIDGGEGIDTIRFSVQNDQTIDFKIFTAFEQIDTGLYTGLTGKMTLKNVSNVSQIWLDTGGSLVLQDSQATGANIGFASNSVFTLSSNSAVASYGLSDMSPLSSRANAIADTTVSATVINDGRISGDVAFFGGDDRYSGTFGTAGGTVYGFSGNDILTGGGFADRLDGGRGADTLSGGMGDDVLTGGLGSDIVVGGTGNDLAIFERNFADYRFAFSATDVTVTRGTDVDRVTGIERYQFADITIDTRDGSPLVDDLFYLANNRDVARAGIDADVHFATNGWREGRDPNALFDLSAYLGANRDIAMAGIDPLDHYARTGYRENRDPSILFDSEQYLAENPDVAASGMDPLSHYLAFGRDEGRDIDPAVGSRIVDDFDATYYLLANEDVASSGIDARAHYDQFGAKEGRDPNAYFDTSWYLAANSDVAASGLNPLDHFVRFGWREGRDPSAQFDTSAYLQRNGDVAAANIDPLGHYLTNGRLEGRSLDPAADFGFATVSLALRVPENIFDLL